MFFAYLRARAPAPGPGSDSISQLPRSLVALINETAYPPPRPKLLESVAPNVLMIVDTVSPTPFVMLERARNLDYRASNHVLRSFAEHNNPAKALTAECSRVFEMIASNIQANKVGTATPPDTDASWTRFEDMGFSGLNRKTDTTNGGHSQSTSINGPSSPSRRISSRRDQSWADFMSTGFSDENGTSPPPLALPAKQYMPTIGNDNGPTLDDSSSILPGELASVEQLGLDETFWWVWMESLAPEESSDRKAVFGRCVLAELDITGGRWLVIEEQMRPAVQTVQTIQEDVVSPSAISSERKRPFFATMKSRTTSSQRQMSSNSMPRVSSSQQTPILGFDNDTGYSSAQSTPVLGADQHALIQAAAAQLVEKGDTNGVTAQRRGRKDADADAKTVSVLSMQPVFVKDAGPALQWARRFDKEITRSRFDDQASEMNSISDAAPASRIILPGSTSKDDVAANQSQASPGAPEASSMAAVAAILHSPPAEDTPRKEEMVPSPLRIPKRKPVATSPSPLSPKLATNETASIDGLSSDTAQLQDIPKVNGEVTTNDDTAPAFEKSNVGSRRGLRNFFKRKVTDPTAKIAAQRAASGNSDRAVSGSTIAEGQEAGQQEPRHVSRKRSLLKNKLDRATATNSAPEKEPATSFGEGQSYRASFAGVERRKFGPEAPAKLSGDTTSALVQPRNMSPATAASPTMTSQSAAFGAARPGMLEDASNNIEPPSPAFSNFTSAANMDQDRTDTMSTVPEIRHARTETMQSMPAYALNFDPGSPQRAFNSSLSQNNGVANYQTRTAALLAQTKAAPRLFSPRESSTVAQEPTTASIASPTATVYQTPLESSDAFPQNPLGSHPPEQSLPTATSSGAQEEYMEVEENEDGAPRPNTQERLASASTRWAAIRQVAQETRGSEEPKNITPPGHYTPPWQKQASVGNEYAGASEASGFSPGPANTANGLGIAGVSGIEREQPKLEEECE